MNALRRIPKVLVAAGRRAGRVHLTRMAAAIAFYALFSLPALLLMTVHLAGLGFGEAEARGRLLGQVHRHLGSEAALTVDELIEGAADVDASRPLPRALAMLMLLFGASLSFYELQHALNVIWGGGGRRRGLPGLLLKRLASFAMVLAAGLLLLATMTASVAVRHFGGWLEEGLTAGWAPGLLAWVEPLIALTLVTGLFMLVFKLLPDAGVPWRRAAIGALVTATLLLIARALVTRYVAAVGVGTIYGTAGSLVGLFVWVYVSAVVVLAGGAFAFAWEETCEPAAPAPPPAE